MLDGTVAAASAGLVAVLLASCSGPNRVPTDVARPSTTAQAPSSVPTTTAAMVSLSPRSITVTSKQFRGNELVLDVLAPAQTRFALGANQASAVPCRDVVMVHAERIRHRVVCPGNVATGGSLVSTVTLGDFEATFTTPL